MSYVTNTLLTGINVKDEKDLNYAKLICNGEKIIETRNSPSLNSCLGQRVRIIRTGIKKEKSKIIGEVTLDKVKEYISEEDFYKDSKKHLIDKNSIYKFETKKYGYILKDPILYDTPYDCIGLGYVIRKNQPPPFYKEKI